MEMDETFEKLLQSMPNSMQKDFDAFKTEYGEGFMLFYYTKTLALHAKTLDLPVGEAEYALLKSHGEFVYSHLDEIEEALRLGVEVKRMTKFIYGA